MNERTDPTTPLADEVRELRATLESNDWTAPLRGGYPKPPVVDSLPTAAAEFEGELRRVRAIPGTSASYLATCLGSSTNPTTYSWKTIATG